MLFLIGLVIVTVSVVIGYTMYLGDLRLLWQPNEIVIIIGAGIGSMLISNPWYVIKDSFKSLVFLFKERPYKKADYLQLLNLFFSLSRIIKTKGMLEVESHIENPTNSVMFSNAPVILKNKKILNFIRDNFRLLSMGVDNVHHFEVMVDQELDIVEQTTHTPGKVFLTLGDSFPALGIVAAVLGVIITMRSILEPPEVLGSMIAAALVGTFAGVLLAYGLCNPIGYFLSKYADSEVSYFECIKSGFIAYLYGHPPAVIVEFMRKNIPTDVKPTFDEVDKLINQ